MVTLAGNYTARGSKIYFKLLFVCFVNAVYERARTYAYVVISVFKTPCVVYRKLSCTRERSIKHILSGFQQIKKHITPGRH